MRLLAVHTCPLWESLEDGRRGVVMSPNDVPERGRLVGWCNALEVRIDGDVRMLLAVRSGA